ncbi:hypothetical protein K488DRAFT_52754 [Vararia minispora EC-137]|uniref:Uncharacterized protein n=1 Tax=Vararia minispora EC-137 TaxID=1314806 RepID=A0ACB8QHT0_9AGAM|nr:hypothetical protein K488DRAFT_52754 [Vararia minispora EC-137]
MHAYVKRNLKTIQSIHNLTVYPNNVPIITSGVSAVPPGLFSQNVTGRVTPVGNFSGFGDNIEYFFALAPMPQTNAAGVAFYEAEIVEYVSGCANVASSVVYFHTGPVNNVTGGLLSPNAPTASLKQVAFWRFDDAGLVTHYDAWIPTLQLWVSATSGINYADPLVQEGLVAQQLCPQIQQRCTGANEQYPDVETCVADLSQKPFGSFDEAWGDNNVCRLIHLILTVVRPDVHCPHVGPLGGNGPDNFKCVNISFNDPSYYTNDDILFSGEDFRC